MSRKPTAELEISLKYDGPAVQSGAMAVEDIVPVLQGFAGAYNKVASVSHVSTQHKLRLTDIRQGSAHLVLDIWSTLADHPQTIQAALKVTAAAMSIVGTIIGVIKLKKHTQGKPYHTKVEGVSGDVTVINAENVTIDAPLEHYNAFKSESIDADLSKIVRPLEEGRINETEIRVEAEGHETIEETISASDKPLFDKGDTSMTTTKETWLTGSINSMVKSTNSGHIYLIDGSRVHFIIKAESPSDFYQVFSHQGPVKVRCVAHMDESLKPTHLDIFEMIPIQSNLFESDD